MATLNLLPRKKFEIVLESGEIIRGQFGTWATFRFCKKKGVGLEDLYTILTSLKIDDVVDFVLCAIEQTAREEGMPFTATDVDLCKWTDEMGGSIGSGLISIFNHYGSDDEKKSTVKEDNPSPGQDSSELPPPVE